MWPFKKKKKIIEEESIEKETVPKEIIQQDASAPITTIVCIPGEWNDRDEFNLGIIKSTNGKYIAAAGVLLNVEANRHFMVEFCNPDPGMAESFAYAGKVTRITDESVNAIGKHRSVIYLSAPGGNLENAEHIARAATEILKAGGLGIKIETAGKAFAKEKWLELMNNFKETPLYPMFVIDSITMEDGTVFSCGMHNLGFRDTIVSGEEHQYGVDLISVFGCYQLIDKPKIISGQTFALDVDALRFRITEETDPPYKEEELFGNPFGMWRLSRVSDGR
jgi:hypothetical protein